MKKVIAILAVVAASVSAYAEFKSGMTDEQVKLEMKAQLEALGPNATVDQVNATLVAIIDKAKAVGISYNDIAIAAATLVVTPAQDKTSAAAAVEQKTLGDSVVFKEAILQRVESEAIATGKDPVVAKQIVTATLDTAAPTGAGGFTQVASTVSPSISTN